MKLDNASFRQPTIHAVQNRQVIQKGTFILHDTFVFYNLTSYLILNILIQGVYWSWNGGPREGRGAEALEKGGQISGGGGAGGGWDSIYENDQSSKVLSIDTAKKLFDTSVSITGAEWPTLKQVTSPCPTLKVIGAVTKGMVKREELKRMRELGRPGMSDDELEVIDKAIELAEAEEEQAAAAVAIDSKRSIDVTTIKERPKAKFSKTQRVVMATDKVVGFVLKNTIGRVARLVGGKLLGKIPETAKAGSYHEEVSVDHSKPEVVDDAPATISNVGSEDLELIEEAIFDQIREDKATAAAATNKKNTAETLFGHYYHDVIDSEMEGIQGKTAEGNEKSKEDFEYNDSIYFL